MLLTHVPLRTPSQIIIFKKAISSQLSGLGVSMLAGLTSILKQLAEHAQMYWHKDQLCILGSCLHIEVGQIRFVKGNRKLPALERFQNHPQLASNGYIGHWRVRRDRERSSNYTNRVHKWPMEQTLSSTLGLQRLMEKE